MVMVQTKVQKTFHKNCQTWVLVEQRKLKNIIWSFSVNLQAVRFEGFNNPEAKCYQMSSFGESKAQTLLAESGSELVRYNMTQLSRVYPGASRQDSSNLEPSQPWAGGCQIGDMFCTARSVICTPSPQWPSTTRQTTTGTCSTGPCSGATEAAATSWSHDIWGQCNENLVLANVVLQRAGLWLQSRQCRGSDLGVPLPPAEGGGHLRAEHPPAQQPGDRGGDRPLRGGHDLGPRARHLQPLQDRTREEQRAEPLLGEEDGVRPGLSSPGHHRVQGGEIPSFLL